MNNTKVDINKIKISKIIDLNHLEMTKYRFSLIKLKNICINNKIKCINNQKYDKAADFRDLEKEINKYLFEFDINNKPDYNLLLKLKEKITTLEIIINTDIDSIKYNL